MSCQDQCVSSYSDAATEFYSDAMRKAAKPYTCEECGDAIAKGDRYEYASGKTEGDFWTFRTCATCVEIRNAFCCDGWVLTTLWEEIRDQLFSQWDEMKAIDCLAKLESPAGIAKMRAKYAEYQKVPS